MPCRSTRCISTGSTLPPESTATTGPSKVSGAASSAATGLAPAGSTTSLARSRQSSSAADNWSSLTVRTSSTSSPTIPNGTTPGRPTLMPSAIVAGFSNDIGRPAASEGG